MMYNLLVCQILIVFGHKIPRDKFTKNLSISNYNEKYNKKIAKDSLFPKLMCTFAVANSQAEMGAPIITLTTDWGTQDFFVGMAKGRLLSHIPDARIVDIAHDIKAFDLSCASFVVKNACLNFPPGTIHIIDVNSSNGQHSDYVLVLFRQQYYLCTDNGLPSAAFGYDDVTAYKLRTPDNYSSTFVAFDLFCEVANRIVSGADPSELGTLKPSLEKSTPLGYRVVNNDLQLLILYVDHYGNGYLNITKEEFDSIAAGRKFEFHFREYIADKILHEYAPIPNMSAVKSHMRITVSATGHLQLSIPNDSAEQLLGVKFKAPVTVKFTEE